MDNNAYFKNFNDTNIVRTYNFSRYHGGMNTIEPQISGNFIQRFLKVPDLLFQKSKNFYSNLEIQNIISNNCLQVNVPNVSLETTTITGVQGKTFSIPTILSVNNDISLKFYEFSGYPMYDIFTNWIHLIRNLNTRTSPLNHYNKNNYQGVLMIIYTDMTMMGIEKAFLFDGVFPKTYPTDILNQDIQVNDKLEVNITYSFDNMYDFDEFDDDMKSLQMKYVNLYSEYRITNNQTLI